MKTMINGEPHYIQWHHENNIGATTKKISMSNYVKVEPKESFTECKLIRASDKCEILSTKAVLGKKEKHFCKEKGRKVSLRKLLSKLNISKEERTFVWAKYFIETNQFIPSSMIVQ